MSETTIQKHLEREKYREITELCSRQEKGFTQKKAETLLKYLNPSSETYNGNLWISDHYIKDIVLDTHLDCSKRNSTPYFQTTHLVEELSYLDETHHLNLVQKVKDINQKYEKKLQEEEDKISKMTEGEICEYYQELAQKYQEEKENSKNENNEDDGDSDGEN